MASDFLSFRLREEFIAQYRGRDPQWGFPMGAGNSLGEHSFLTKYSRRKDDGTRERFWEALGRVISGMYSIQKDHASRNRLPWDEEAAHRSAQEAYERAFAGKWSPPGRGLWVMGTEMVNGKWDSSALYNCFVGDTRFLTDRGVSSLAESAGEDVRVWTASGWQDALVRRFGKRRVQRITFAPFHARSNVRMVVTATPDHRWELKNGTVTTSLAVGDFVPAAAPASDAFSEDGFRHGLIFGDGSAGYRYINGDRGYQIRLCGEKKKHAWLFTRTTTPRSYGEDVMSYYRSAVDLKAVPTVQDTNYLHSFVLGWAAADGERRDDNTREQKPFKIDTQDQEAAAWLADYAAMAGFVIRGHSIWTGPTNYGNRSAALHRFTLADARISSGWTVKAIEPLDEEEEVYCAVVPGIERFTLADGIYTGNCSMLSTEEIGNLPDPSLPFTRLMDQLMLGVGVGFDTRGAGKLTLHEPHGRVPHTVGDSREGWCEATGNLLRAFLLPGRKMPVFDYGRVRPAGAPIKGFGGVASGPGILQQLHEQVASLLSGRQDEPLTSRDITDIGNLIGKAVVAGNVRRSAEIALGEADDEEFLNLKDWDKNPVRMGPDGWGHLSNNSVLAQAGGNYAHLAERIARNGEPGIIWLDLMQQYGRLADPRNDKDYRVCGANPCGEISLENHGLCCLVETFPENCEDLQDYLRTLKFAYLYAKSITLLPTRWPESNEVITRSRRIGTSMTGVVQFAEQHGWAELRRWQDAGYAEVRRWDRVYSEWLGVRESIKVTTVKPSGTVSLLHGATPGVHWPRERGFYVRTVRDMKGSPFARAMEEAGYPVEPSVMDPDTTVVITLPVEGPDIRSEREVSLWEKASLAALCQRWWSDNAVSVTVTFRADEADQIPAVLRAFDGQLKTVSFLPMAEGTYQQAPYQRVSREHWEELRSRVRPVDWDALYQGDGLPEATGESYCSSDVCEVPR